MKRSISAILASLLLAACGCERPNPSPPSQEPEKPAEAKPVAHEELVKTLESSPSRQMNQPGLVGAMGGSRVKLLKAGNHELLMTLPQLADHHVPVCFFIRSTPADAMVEYRLEKRDETNVVVNVKLKGEQNQEVQIEWVSVILLTRKSEAAEQAPPKDYQAATACVQSEDKTITKLAEELWPKSGRVNDYAANIQRHIREMKQVKRPQSLDALGILESGMNGICTANANLTLALMRSKGIACRSLAVIPPISHRLEMHRIVEYFDDGRWLTFDPSFVHADVPMKPWQSIIVARTTVADENLAMKPRMSMMRGCPYGQEGELLTDGIGFWGQDFFWTIAKPLVEFDCDEQAATLASEAWKRYLETGSLSAAQLKAASATNVREFLSSLQSRG